MSHFLDQEQPNKIVVIIWPVQPRVILVWRRGGGMGGVGKVSEE